MADALDLGSSEEIRESSSLSIRIQETFTRLFSLNFVTTASFIII